MSHRVELKEGAFIISDAHYSPARPELLNFLKDIINKKLNPSQIIFMGDIFDALFGSIKRTYNKNQKLINIINKISLNIEVIYLEGNHDFNLKNIFPNSKIFTISNQPIVCEQKNKKIYLAHGDFNGDSGYKIYTALIRNPVVLFILNILNTLFGNFVLNYLDNHLSKKDDCANIDNFEQIIKKRFDKKYDCDYFIEGHHHQNKVLKLNNFIYINLAAFACNQRYFIVEFAKEEFLVCKTYLEIRENKK